MLRVLPRADLYNPFGLSGITRYFAGAIFEVVLDYFGWTQRSSFCRVSSQQSSIIIYPPPLVRAFRETPLPSSSYL